MSGHPQFDPLDNEIFISKTFSVQYNTLNNAPKLCPKNTKAIKNIPFFSLDSGTYDLDDDLESLREIEQIPSIIKTFSHYLEPINKSSNLISSININNFIDKTVKNKEQLKLNYRKPSKFKQ